MTIPEFLKELEPYTGRFPLEAMKAAIEQREAITPELLRVVEAVAETPVEFAKRQNYMVHVFALFLRAQFRETRAYLPIVKMFSAPGETPFDLAGDTVTEGLSQILASIYDGNPAPLQGLVESEQVNEFVRSAALDAFVVLEHTGQMPREAVVEYFRSLFHGKLLLTPSNALEQKARAQIEWPGAPNSADSNPRPVPIGRTAQWMAAGGRGRGGSSCTSIGSCGQIGSGETGWRRGNVPAEAAGPGRSGGPVSRTPVRP